MPRIKIHYNAGAWHGGYPEFFKKALLSLGHEVFYFDDFGSRRQQTLTKIFMRVPRMQYRVFDYFRKEISRDWLRSVQSFKPDLIILAHTPNTLPEDIRLAKKDGAKVFYWMDAPPTGAQAKDAIAGCVEADAVFSVDRKWMTILYGPDDFFHLPVAGDPETFYPAEGVRKEYDVLFLGSFPPQTGDGYLRAKIINEIPKKYRVVVFGNGADYWTRQFPELKERIKSGSILRAEKLNEIYNKTNIVLNIHSTSNTSSLSARTYEIALSGAFQLVDWREDLDTQFPVGSFVTFRYAREINGLIEEWLRKPDERARRARRVREHVLNHHTWRHRAEEMLKRFLLQS